MRKLITSAMFAWYFVYSPYAGPTGTVSAPVTQIGPFASEEACTTYRGMVIGTFLGRAFPCWNTADKRSQIPCFPGIPCDRD